MNSCGYCVRISLKHADYTGTTDETIAKAKIDALAFAQLPHISDVFFVYEVGEAEGKHLHGYFKTHKTRNTIVSYLKKAFSIEDGNTGYSLKKADPAKMQDYLKYCAKGIDGNRNCPVEVIYEDEVHLWDILHKNYHDTADQIKERISGKRGCEAWYEDLANALIAEGKTKKEDVLARVCRYYTHESKKGFEKFAVTRTFWRVYALVNGSEAQSLIYDSVAECVFRV